MEGTVEPSFDAECILPEGRRIQMLPHPKLLPTPHLAILGLPLGQDRTAGSGTAGAAGWCHNKACSARAGGRTRPQGSMCMPGRGHGASPAGSQNRHKHRIGRSSGSVLPRWGDPEGLPTDILQYHPSGKSGDGDLHVYLTVQENVFQV